MDNFKNYFKYVSFCKYLKRHKTYKELYRSTAGKLSLLLALLTVLIMGKLYYLPISEAKDIIVPFVLTLLGGLLGLLGFIISGLAIILGMITHKTLEKINLDEKAESFVAILFSFYFEGAIIGVAIIMLSLVYLGYHGVIFFTISNCLWWFVFYLVTYISYFAIFYSIGLLGTLLNMFFLNLKKSK